MSKSNIRKITVDPTKCNTDSRRPSVFERLGTKPPTVALTTLSATPTTQSNSDYCRNWALNGSCSYGKNCKYASTHTLISPSKRVKKDNAPANAVVPIEDQFKRLTSKIVKKTTSHSPDLNLEDWNQTDLEYEDEKVLERRRQLLQRELEIQMKKDKEVHGKDKTTKHKKKAMSSSSSSHSSSTSSSSSSSSSDDSSSSSTSDSRKKVKKVKSKRHHSASSDYDEDRERKKKLKLKRLGTKSEKLVVKKKRKIEVPSKKEPVVKVAKKAVLASSRKSHSSTARAKSPVVSAHASTSKIKERNRSESPKAKTREAEKDKHYKKLREEEIPVKEIAKAKIVEKSKEPDVKSRSRPIEERAKGDGRSKQRIKEPERRSRTPPIDKSKHQYSKEIPSAKSRRSRTPEKPVRSKREPTPLRHQESKVSASRSREIEKKERDLYKGDRSKDKDDIRKSETQKIRPSSSQEDPHRKNTARDIEEKNYANERNRQRSKERRDDRSHSRLARDQRDSQRDKEREEVQERCRDRQRDRDREKEPVKIRERDIPPLMATAALNPMDKNGRYARDKERFKDGGLEKAAQRDRRSERDRERSEKPLERERGLPRYDARYDRSLDKEMPPHKTVERERPERFQRERSMDRIVEKNPPPGACEHIMERENVYDRDRHRRFNPRFDRGHPQDHERKEPPHIPPKIERLPDRREGSRRSLEMERNYDRGYARLPPDHWEESEEPQRMDYRDHHPHEDERRKPMETRRYNSPFEERRGRDDRPPRYAMQNERPFEDPHLPIFPGEKMRPGPNRDESSNENWEVHHELEHPGRDRNYQNAEWEEREWRARPPLWERESPQRSEVHEEEWAPRYDSPMPDWKMNEGRKWENPALIRGPFRNDRIKEIDLAELHSKRRPPYGTPELRDECSTHGSKQGSLHGSMKEEPINKKLMELAEGRIRKSREKSVENFQKRIPPREKSEVKESPLTVEPKRPCLDESLQTLHTESDLSDISDDPDDILNMEEEEIEAPKLPAAKKGPEVNESVAATVPAPEVPQLSPKDIVEDAIFTKEKDNNETMEFRNIEEDNLENMDFEEISDGELEEDIKTSGKGLGDALGVDWESLVKESQPRRVATVNQETAQSRWQCKAIFQRIGISVRYAGAEAVEAITRKYCADNDSEKLLLNDVALLHTALVRQRFVNHTTRNLSANDDLLNRNYATEEEEEDEETLKPCTSLYEEAKILLQQVG